MKTFSGSPLKAWNPDAPPADIRLPLSSAIKPWSDPIPDPASALKLLAAEPPGSIIRLK
jgi:hypothetical protein